MRKKKPTNVPNVFPTLPNGNKGQSMCKQVDGM